MAGPERRPFDKGVLLQANAAVPDQFKEGVTWINGQPAIRNGDTTVKLAHNAIVVDQGGTTSARFYIAPQGTGIILVPPPGNSRETYNTQTHQYVNTNTAEGDKTGNYPNGPPPGMMAKLAPFVQIAMKAVDQAKQTPDGAKWDDIYFRKTLQPYNTAPAPAPGQPQVKKGPQVQHP